MSDAAQSPQRPVKASAMLPRERRKPLGRDSIYKPEYCEITETLGKQGKSISEIALVLNVGRRTLYEWEANYPEFAQALGRARTFAQAWWEGKAHKSLGRKHFQAQLWRYSMAGRFKEDYAEQRQDGGSGSFDLGQFVGGLVAGAAGKVGPVIDVTAESDAPKPLDVVPAKR